MSFTPYHGERYLDFHELEVWLKAAAVGLPAWATLEEAGRSLHGRPIWLLTIGAVGPERASRPAFWLDGGTHASEFTGVMSALFSASTWLEALAAGEPGAVAWFSSHTVHVMPCISPDGFQAMCEGAPFMRSTLRPGQLGAVRSGLDPEDLDGDGQVRWMRWRHPAGAFVQDEEVPLFMRPRTLDDDPEDAWFVCTEGRFLNWDGVRWGRAEQRFGLDLNRNFPGSWAPFEMFGMDGGAFPGSAPESRALIDAVAARPHIAAAVTNHTYTGCLLTQPYREATPLQKPDIDLMEALARDAVEGTGYDVFKVVPHFSYDPKKPITGVWADTMATVFGFPGYTLELWNPMKYAGVEMANPLDFLMRPEPGQMRQVLRHFCLEPGLFKPWAPFEHPQLGPVEIGGLDYLRTIRNPPEALLAQECRKGHAIIDRVRRSLPAVRVEARAVPLGADQWRLEVDFENLGFLPTSGLAHGESVQATPKCSARLALEGAVLRDGAPEVLVGHLEGWGQTRVGSGRNAIYAGLPVRGHRARVSWVVEGAAGTGVVHFVAGRAGCGQVEVRWG